MGTSLHQFFAWLPEGALYYLIIALIACGESLVGIGLLLPGSTLCVFAGFLALHGQGEISLLIITASIGAFAGDLISYLLGARIGSGLLKTSFMKKRLATFRQAELFFARHGGKSVFLGRFFGPVRGFVPFVAGCAMMRPGAFCIIAAISAALWGLAYPGLGYLAGASWQNVQRWSGRFSLLMVAVLASVVISVLVRRRLK